jgi:hypothetical protein
MRALRILSLAIWLTCLLASAQEAAAPAPADAQQSQAQQSHNQQSQAATVYVYRYKQFVGSALAPSVYCDEVQLARMDNGRYFTARLDAGKHNFRSNDAQSGVELDLKAGQSYFIRVEIAAGMMKGHGRLILMSPEQGSYELKSSKLKPLDASKVVDKERVSVEEAHVETPVPTPQAPVNGAASPTAQPKNSEHSVTGQTVSGGDGTLVPASQTGDQISVAEAAHRAQQKKEPAK